MGAEEFIIQNAKNYLTPEKIYFFGSRSRGTNRRTSDYDFAFVLGDKGKANWANFTGVVEDEFPSLCDVDLVNLADCDAKLRENILSTGRQIYAI